MDTLKTLMDKHEYELIVKLTEKSSDVDSIFYRISAFLGIGKGEEALNCLKAHHKELHQNLFLLIKVHIDLLIILGRFDEAYDELDYYKNLPYESQQVEELLSSMVGHIREEERQQFNKPGLTNDEIKSRLRSQDKTAVMSALDLAGSRDINLFLEDIQFVMLNNPIQAIRSFALMLLVQKKIDKELNFNGSNGIIKINPKNTKPPFIDEKFNRICRTMISQFKNPSISDSAIDILSTYIIDIFPDQLSEEDEYIIGSLYLICCECLQIKDSQNIEEYCAVHNLDKNKLYELYQKFENLIKNL